MYDIQELLLTRPAYAQKIYFVAKEVHVASYMIAPPQYYRLLAIIRSQAESANSSSGCQRQDGPGSYWFQIITGGNRMSEGIILIWLGREHTATESKYEGTCLHVTLYLASH